MTESYYDVLDVSSDASEETIKDAYREKVKEYHPDQSDDPNAQAKFRKVREAKETLLDSEARRRYDRRQGQGAAEEVGDDQNGSAESSEEWARKQRRQERQQRREQQRRQRQRRYQRRERRQRRGRYGTSRGSGPGSRERSGRQTETRTREREETSSRERDRRANRSARDRVRSGISWMRDLYHRPRRWVRTLRRSPEVVRQLVVDVAKSPTTIRLSAAVALMLTVTQIALVVGLSPTTSPTIGFVIVLGSLIVSYATYAVVSPLPFEEPRSRGRFKPAGRSPIWPAVAMNLLGFGLFGLAAMNGAEAAGIAFTMGAGIYAVVLFLIFAFTFTFLLMGASRYLTGYIFAYRSLKYGLLTAPIGAVFVMFTRYTDGATLPDKVSDIIGAASTNPWVSPFAVGPFYLGAFMNFVIALVIIGCLLGSVLTMCRYLTVVPWSDRYEHGYRVRPAIWNLIAIAPFIVLGWMYFTGVSVVDLGMIELRQAALWIGVFVLPTILAGAYIIRRQIEPRLQQRV